MAHGEFIAMRRLRHDLRLPRRRAAAGRDPAAARSPPACSASLLERTIVHRFYHRPIDSLVATWGISLIMTQGALLVLGSALPSIGTPFGSVVVRRLIVLGLSPGDLRRWRSCVLVGLYLLFMKTTLRRATPARPCRTRRWRARSGVPVDRIYSITFGIGAALAGLAGGMYAPTMTLSPTMGSSFVIEAFVTVVAGGADVLVGTAPAAAVAGRHQGRGHRVLRPGLRRHRPPGRRLHRHPAAAGRASPAGSSVAAPEAPARGTTDERPPVPAQRPADLRQRPRLLGRRAGGAAAGRWPIRCDRRQLHGRQPRLFRRLGVHGAGPVR